MKTTQLATLAALAAIASACSEEELVRTENNPSVVKDRIEATMNQGDTRTYLAEDNASINWSEDDQILVYTSYCKPLRYDMYSGAGETSATFYSSTYDAISDGEKQVAFYPYTADIAESFVYNLTYKYIDFVLPDIITWQEGADLNGFPMVGLFTEGSSSVQFRNACAILDLTLTDVPAEYNGATLTSLCSDDTGDAPYLNGAARIVLRAEDADISDISDAAVFNNLPDYDVDNSKLFPFLKVGEGYTFSTTFQPSTQTFIKFDAAEEVRDIRILLPLPLDATYSLELAIGTRVEYTSDAIFNNVHVVETLSPIVAERNTRYVRTVSCGGTSGEEQEDAPEISTETRTVADAAEATAALAGTDGNTATTSVIVQTISMGDNTITIPANQVDGAQAVNLNLEVVEYASSLQIDAGTSSRWQVAKNVNVTAGFSTFANSATSLTLDLPNSEVTLNSESSDIWYQNVTLSAPNSVLHLGCGVHVDNLHVAEGSVVFVNSYPSQLSTISVISSEGSVTTPTATIYDAGGMSTTYSDNVYIYPQTIYDMQHTSGTYTLTKALTLTSPLVIQGDNITIDLGAYMVTKNVGSEAPFIVDGATNVIIKGTGSSMIEATGCDCAVLARNGGSVTIEKEGDSTIPPLSIYGGAHGVFATSNGSITLNDVLISGTTTQPIYAEDGGNITITAGNYTTNSDDEFEVVKVTGNSAFTMTGGSIYSYATTLPAIQVCNGSTGIIGGPSGETYVWGDGPAVWISEDGASSAWSQVTIQGSFTQIVSEYDHCVQLFDNRNAGSMPVTLTVQGEAEIRAVATPTYTSSGVWDDAKYAVCGDASAHLTEINIEGGTLYSNSIALYHPQEGTLNISGGRIEGSYGAVEIGAGTLNLTGGTLYTGSGTFATNPRLEGHTTNGAALAIVPTRYDDGLEDPEVHVSIAAGADGNRPTLEGTYALYERNLIGNASTLTSSMAVSAGVFTGSIYSGDFSSFITGGTFKSIYTSADLDGYLDNEKSELTINMEGGYTVVPKN
jgi:hypothetical protein